MTAASLLECALGNGGGPTFEAAMEEAANLRQGFSFYEEEEDADEDNDSAADSMAGRGRHAGNPADIALLAAAAPEPVKTPPAGNEGEPWVYMFSNLAMPRAGKEQSTQDVLSNMVADWRAKAEIARTQATAPYGTHQKTAAARVHRAATSQRSGAQSPVADAPGVEEGASGANNLNNNNLW